MTLPEDKLIVLFDGVCNFCNGAVNFLIKRDKRDKFRFIALQNEKAKQILKSFELHQDNFSSIILIQNNKVYKSSTSILRILNELPWAWKTFYIFIILPKTFRDFLYEIIARNRYRIFGKRKTCRVPSESEELKFI